MRRHVFASVFVGGTIIAGALLATDPVLLGCLMVGMMVAILYKLTLGLWDMTHPDPNEHCERCGGLTHELHRGLTGHCTCP